MPQPTGYNTEAELAGFMLTELKSTAEELEWSDTSSAGPFQSAVNNTLEEYGVDDIADATDAVRLRALARYHVWDAVVTEMVRLSDWSADGASYDDSTIYDHALKQRDDRRAQVDRLLALEVENDGILERPDRATTGAVRNQVSW